PEASDIARRPSPGRSGDPFPSRPTPAPPPLPRELAPEPARELQLVASMNEADDADQVDDRDGFDDHPAPVVDAEPEPEPEPQPVAAPDPPVRPRLGLGTFADLRGAVQPSAPPPATVAPTPETERPAAEPAVTSPA